MWIIPNLGMLLGYLSAFWHRVESTTVSESPSTQEFCQNEVFTVQCPLDSVVYISSAFYGRMRIGRCVRKDYGFVGCSQDVIGIVDSFCGGRRACNVPVPNQYFDAAAEAQCPEDFRHFLEVKYECVKVVHVTKPSCRIQSVRTDPEGVIPSVVTLETDCGSDLMPWRIELLPGQRINVTLYDFMYASKEMSAVASAGDVMSGAKCVAYAIFKELAGAPSQTLCGGRERVSTAYTSKSEKLQIVILKRGEPESHRYFLLKYNAVGCGYPVAPTGGWSVRVNEEAFFGCNGSSMTWRLRCHGSRWIGTAYNCTIPENTLSLTGGSFVSSLTFEMAVGAVVFIALIIASLILCIGILLIRRHGRSKKPILEMLPPGSEMYDVDGLGGGSDCMIRTNDLDRDSDQYRDLNDYAYIDANQQIHGLQPPCRHGGLSSPHANPFADNNPTALPSHVPTPYSTLERNTPISGSAAVSPPVVDWKTENSPTKMERKAANATLRGGDWQTVHSCGDVIVTPPNTEANRRLSYQIKHIVK